MPRLGRLHRVVHHGGRVAALLMANDGHVGALRPNGQLLVRRGAEGVRRRQHHAAPDFLKAQRQLADRRGLSHAVHAHHEHHHGPFERRARNVHFLNDNLLEDFLRALRVRNFFRRQAGAQLLHNLQRRGHSNVRQNQNVRQFVVKILVHRAGILHQFVHLVRQAAACFGQSLLEPLKKAHANPPFGSSIRLFVILQIHRHHA